MGGRGEVGRNILQVPSLCGAGHWPLATSSTQKEAEDGMQKSHTHVGDPAQF